MQTAIRERDRQTHTDTETDRERETDRQTEKKQHRQQEKGNTITFPTSDSNVEDTLGKVAFVVSCGCSREQMEVLLPYTRHQLIIRQKDVQIISLAVPRLEVDVDVDHLAVFRHVHHHQLIRTVEEVGICARKVYGASRSALFPQSSFKHHTQSKTLTMIKMVSWTPSHHQSRLQWQYHKQKATQHSSYR